jgi:hypothetical protein
MSAKSCKILLFSFLHTTLLNSHSSSDHSVHMCVKYRKNTTRGRHEKEWIERERIVRRKELTLLRICAFWHFSISHSSLIVMFQPNRQKKSRTDREGERKSLWLEKIEIMWRVIGSEEKKSRAGEMRVGRKFLICSPNPNRKSLITLHFSDRN